MGFTKRERIRFMDELVASAGGGNKMILIFLDNFLELYKFNKAKRRIVKMEMRKKLKQYERYLIREELSEGTRAIYLRQAKKFVDFLGEQDLTKEKSIQYKKNLLSGRIKAVTVNLYIVAVNRFLQYGGWKECVIKTKRIQKKQCLDNVLCLDEYRMLLDYAKESGREKYYYIMKTLALTGIRISELKYFTVERLSEGKITVNNKQKVREIYLPDKLIEELNTYCAVEKIKKGIIFIGNGGKPICRSAVNKMLLYMADMTGIEAKRVHPHSFRHLFAVTYMKSYGDMCELADILGHTSLETTRIYTKTSVEEKRRRMNAVEL